MLTSGSIVSEGGSNRPQIAHVSPCVSSFGPSLNQIWTSLVKVWPTLTDVDRLWPNLVTLRPTSVQKGARCEPKSGSTRPKCMWTNICVIGRTPANLGQPKPNLRVHPKHGMTLSCLTLAGSGLAPVRIRTGSTKSRAASTKSGALVNIVLSSASSWFCLTNPCELGSFVGFNG